MKKPKAILYDNDGMVARGGRFSEEYTKEFGVDTAVLTPFFEGPFKKCLIGEADLKEELAKVLDVWKWKGTVDELLQYWFSVGDTPHEEVYVSVVKFKEQGLVVCLATNNEKYRVQYLIKKLSYDTIFDHIFSSADLGAYKQSFEGAEKIYQTLKEKCGILDKEEILYWDDREKNVQNLNNMGFNAQLYHEYDSFRAVMSEYGFQL